MELTSIEIFGLVFCMLALILCLGMGVWVFIKRNDEKQQAKL